MRFSPHRLGLVLCLAAALLIANRAVAEPLGAEDYDVVIEIADGSVSYNGNPVEGMIDLESALVEDVQQDPQLTVEVVAHDTVPYQYVLQIMHMVRQYEVETKLEIVSDGTGGDDNM